MKFENLEKAMCKELETLERKVLSSPEMNVTDLDKIDKLAHALKSLATYEAMKGYDEEEEGFSGRRGRSAMTGQYVSRMPYEPYPYYPPAYSGRY